VPAAVEPPNMRVQRTRALASLGALTSFARSPLTRRPLGSRKLRMGACFIALLALVGFLNGQALVVHDARTASWVIKPGEGVGPIRLGMSREEVKAAVGKPKTTGLAWDYPSDAFSVAFSSGGTVVSVFAGIGSPPPDSESVPEYAFRFKGRTPTGIGIGSTLEEVLADLGTPSTDRKDGSGAESLWYREAHLNISLWHGHVYNIAVFRPAP
jgi:hypothetical protein